jgi:hypothetical protein
MIIREVTITSYAARCEVVTELEHEPFETKDDDEPAHNVVTHRARRFPVRAYSAQNMATKLAEMARLECPQAIVTLVHA